MSYEIIGGNKMERYIAEKCINWCVAKFPLNRVKIKLRFADIKSADGWVEKLDNREFEITISKNYEAISLMTETIIHELVHVRQWITKKWDDDGENEADEVSRDLSKMLWGANLI